MYTNKNAWTNKSGEYKEIFYYVCSRRRQPRGQSCSYSLLYDNVYKVLLNFDRVYDRLNDEEKRTMIQGFIKEIQIYPKEEQDKHEHPIKNITFNFPVYVNGESVDKISWENESTVEAVV